VFENRQKVTKNAIMLAENYLELVDSDIKPKTSESSSETIERKQQLEQLPLNKNYQDSLKDTNRSIIPSREWKN